MRPFHNVALTWLIYYIGMYYHYRTFLSIPSKNKYFSRCTLHLPLSLIFKNIALLFRRQFKRVFNVKQGFRFNSVPTWNQWQKRSTIFLSNIKRKLEIRNEFLGHRLLLNETYETNEPKWVNGYGAVISINFVQVCHLIVKLLFSSATWLTD